MNFTCSFFGEGGKDKNFILTLIELPKFKHHTRKWFFTPSHGSGSSPAIILEQCSKDALGKPYDLILCLIDLDKLKTDFPNKWREQQKSLEQKYSNIQIIWQEDNAEDEYKKALGTECDSKHKLNRLAKQKINRFINSPLWKKILNPIKNKEKELAD